MSTDNQPELTNDPQELLKHKHEADKQKQQFTNFARSVSGNTPVDNGQVSPDKHHEPDQQNNMKDTENRMI
ncbi:hypothetical protein [Fontibacillus sp. BL9]|uniref:hypothetical protein n=1 Tax=Fontibacillus sp. BL9 TaxID=3389971 RepID=UPI003978105B